jgi:hypothetical protein
LPVAALRAAALFAQRDRQVLWNVVLWQVNTGMSPPQPVSQKSGQRGFVHENARSSKTVSDARVVETAFLKRIEPSFVFR